MNFSWIVLNYNCNTNRIEEYDALRYSVEWMRKLKRQCKDIREFSEKLNKEMMWRYWSRAECELMLEKWNNQLFLKPWIGSRNPEEAKIEVTNDLFWQEFSKSTHCRWWDDFAKLDIYDQIRFKWEEFVDYCWNTRLPYERKKK